jgi:cytochrome c oxidase subunit 4
MTELENPSAVHGGVGRYLVCWASLAVLTGLTFGLSHVELGAWAIAAALAIAITKATIVTLFFMHVWDHPGATRLILAGAALFVVVLAALVVADVKTRFSPALPWPQGSAPASSTR